MSKQRKTEPRWINTRVVRDLRTGEELEREGYWYEGAVALATDPPTREATSWQFCTPCGEVVATINSNLIGTKNTNLNLDADTTYYFRAGVEETANNTWKNATIRLLANPVAAGFQQVTTTSTYVRAVADGNTTDGNDSVQSNVTSGEFTLDSTNEGIGHDGLAGGGTADLAQTGFECVFSIQFRSADFSDGQTVVLKLVDSNESDGDLDNYQQTDVTVTVNIPSNPTTVTLNNDSLTLSDGTLGINQSQPPITMVADSFTLTDGTLTVRAEQETRVALTPDSLTLSDGTLTVRAEQETRITLGTDALTLSDGTLGIVQLAPTVVTLSPDSLTLSDGTLTVRAEQETRITMGEAVYYADFNGVAGDYVSTPDSATNSVTGDIDFQVLCAADDWSNGLFQPLIAKFLSYTLRLTSTGAVNVFVYSGATLCQVTSTTTLEAAGFSNGQQIWIRCTVDISTDNVDFYTSTDNRQTWDALGIQQTLNNSASGGIDDNANAVTLGRNSTGGNQYFVGKIYEAYVYDGIDGTLAVDFNASDNPNNNATHVSDGVGETWTWTDINSVKSTTESTPTNLALTDGTLTVLQDQNIALVPDSLTLSDGTLTVRAENENRITLVPNALALTDGTLVVTQSAATPAVETRKKKGGGKLPPLQAPKYNLHMVDGIPPSPKEEQKEKIAELPKKVREIKKEIKRLESIDLSADMVEMDRLVTQEIVLRLKLIEFEERLEQQKKDEERTRLEAAKEADRKLKAERERLREEKRQAELKRLEEQRKAAEKRLKEKLERIRQARLEAERRERAILHREIRESAEQSQELIDRINEQIQQIEDDRERKKREKDLMFVVMAMLQ